MSGAPGPRSDSGSDPVPSGPAGGPAAFLALSRPANGLIAAAAVIVGALVAAGRPEWGDALPAAGAAFAGAAGSNALNDVFDREIDRVNRPERPVASGALSPTAAFIFAFVCYLVAVALVVRVGPWPFLLVAGWAGATAVYSVWLKGVPLVGNVIVACVASSAFVLGGASQKNAGATLLPFALASLVSLARELVKDAEDVEGDGRAGVQTLAVRSGPSVALSAARLVVVVTMAAAALPYALGSFGMGYIVVAVPIEVLLGAVLVALGGEGAGTLRLASGWLKLVMLLGLAAFILGRQ